MRRGSGVGLAVSAGWLAWGAMAPTQAAKVNFSRDVLPILSDKCFPCHGPDAKSRQANLRLDVPEGAFANRDGRYAIVPGKPKSSMLVDRIHDADSPMPPSSSGKTLTAKEKQILTQWIADGAKYSTLWSFEPLPAKVPLPKVADGWAIDPFDRFIQARLKKEGLSPSKPAPRERWLRRVTFDLTGLPPTTEEIAAFEKDASPSAFAKVVDRLLASPHFGERMAVDWLDAARYSDSYGYQSDLLSPTWPYRDWVMRAFNANLSYDRFLTDQLAGDLEPNATEDQRLATAFNRLHRQSNEGGSIALEFKTVYAADRVDTFGTAMLGLTLGCARCHDHKFDPITQRDYYQLFAYFNSIEEYGLLLSTEIVPTPSLLLPKPAQHALLDERRKQDAAAKRAAEAALESAEARFQSWLAQHPVSPEIPGLVAKLPLDGLNSGKLVNTVGGAAFGEPMGKVEVTDKSVKLDGDNGIAVRGLPGRERWDAFTWSFAIKDPRPSANPVILQHRTGGTDVGFCGFDVLLEDGFLTARVMRHWPGNAVAVKTKYRIHKGEWSHVAWSWDGSGRAEGLRIYLDGREVPVEILHDKLWKRINAYGDLGPSRGDWAFGQRFRDAGFKGGRLRDVAFADRALSPIEVAQLADGTSLSKALRSGDAAALRGYYLSAFDKPAQDAAAAMRKAQQALTAVEDGIYEISVMEEATPPIPAYVLARGNYDAPRTDKNRVSRGTPKSLPPLRTSGGNDRLALAKWLTRPDHPLTARVAVNRMWQMMFGAGLVETSENFGVQGSQPTHPELLDYLARQFIVSGWNVKSIMRRLALSATYRQDSTRTKRLNQIDPRNRLYARGPSGRLSAEMVRDAVLAASGLLDDRIGGAPVNPYQPAGIWQENNTMSPGFVQSKGKDLYRRSLYTTWKRTTPMPSMMLFDATSREACVIRRPSTNTPLQALVLLNDVQFVEAARALAERTIAIDSPISDRIAIAFERLAGRAPDQTERGVLLATFEEQRKQFSADESAARRLISLGDSKPDAKISPVDLAAMTVTMQTLMNSDAVVWKR